MKSLWQSLVNLLGPLWPREIFSRHFWFWYSVAVGIGVVGVAGYYAVDKMLHNYRLSSEIQRGEIYVGEEDMAFLPKIEDFYLELDHKPFRLPEQYPFREKGIRRWDLETLNRYWDDIDKQKLSDLRRENEEILRNQLKDLR